MASFLERVSIFFSIGSSGRKDYTNKVLEQSLKDTSGFFKDTQKKNTALQAELDYIYQIFRARDNCVFFCEYNSIYETLLFTLKHEDGGRMSLIVYNLKRQIEIAELLISQKGLSMSIDDLKIAYLNCDKRFGELLVKTLIHEAVKRKLCLISGKFGKDKDIPMDEIEEFFKALGFAVSRSPGADNGIIAYPISFNSK